MQVRDDELRVVDVPVDREDREEDPREAAEDDDETKPSAQSIGVSNEMFPSLQRREPVEDLHRDRHGERERGRA